MKKRNAPPICLSKWNANDLKERTTEIPCKGDYYDLKTILKTNDINEVVFALDENVHVDLERLFNDAKKTDVNITMIPNYNKLLPKNPTVQEIGGVKQLMLGN